MRSLEKEIKVLMQKTHLFVRTAPINSVSAGFEIPASPVARGDQFLLRTTLLLELSSPPGECKIKQSNYVKFPELFLE